MAAATTGGDGVIVGAAVEADGVVVDDVLFSCKRWRERFSVIFLSLRTYLTNLLGDRSSIDAPK